ncbi:MAG: aspartate 1-decarboxylase [Candidatus Aminicenantes bacterium RBG_13_63_10]|nr:MAG: aspartate 1-decarboxylase [Candidatus Aminicenantes bacterium RBG_13_63_10]
MKRIMLKGKIHKAVVTESNLDYEGSLGLDEGLMRSAGMIPFEKVHIYNVTNGERFSTYLIKAKEGSGTVAIYGAAAHRASMGDVLIIVSYAWLDEEETEFYMPKVVILDGANRIQDIKP